MTATATTDPRRALQMRLAEGRRWTFDLLDPLDDEEMARQPHRIMSPLVWDLGHIGNYEELWLLRSLGDRSLTDPDLDTVYNPFDNPRWTRADLPILSRGEATEYIAEVRDKAMQLMTTADLIDGDPLLRDGFVYHLVAQHEAQHQETMLQALDLRGETSGSDADEVADADDPRLRIYLPATARRLRPAPAVDDTRTVVVPGGPFAFGAPDPAGLSPTAPPAAHDAAVAAYDNERPRHLIDVADFAVDVFPVTARRFAAFVEDGGYQNPAWWSERGREWLDAEGHTAPQGWHRGADGEWRIRRFNRTTLLDPRELAEHVTYFEAEAFAAWAGGRLPTEVGVGEGGGARPGHRRFATVPLGRCCAESDARQHRPDAVGAVVGRQLPRGRQRLRRTAPAR